jgi:hypothetical protein
MHPRCKYDLRATCSQIPQGPRPCHVQPSRCETSTPKANERCFPSRSPKLCLAWMRPRLARRIRDENTQRGQCVTCQRWALVDALCIACRYNTYPRCASQPPCYMDPGGGASATTVDAAAASDRNYSSKHHLPLTIRRLDRIRRCDRLIRLLKFETRKHLNW